MMTTLSIQSIKCSKSSACIVSHTTGSPVVGMSIHLAVTELPLLTLNPLYFISTCPLGTVAHQ